MRWQFADYMRDITSKVSRRSYPLSHIAKFPHNLLHFVLKVDICRHMLKNTYVGKGRRCNKGWWNTDVQLKICGRHSHCRGEYGTSTDSEESLLVKNRRGSPNVKETNQRPKLQYLGRIMEGTKYGHFQSIDCPRQNIWRRSMKRRNNSWLQNLEEWFGCSFIKLLKTSATPSEHSDKKTGKSTIYSSVLQDFNATFR
ncbi:hypothetical protein HUJ04_008372 [Dendroctonus ponderosae]|nr:hypothetical protein HUJ04_008372 [Dendroctonus ponderosae]